MKKKEVNIPLIYVYLYSCIKRRSNGCNIVDNKLVLEIMRRNMFNISTNLHYGFLKEMEDYKLIRRINKQKIELIGGDIYKKINSYMSPLW